MLILTKKGLSFGDLQDFLDVGIKVDTLKGETTELELVSEFAGISKGEARRKIKEGAVWLGNEKVTDPNAIIGKGNVAMTLFIGKEFYGLIV